MSIWTVFLLGLGLSMDAFAVSIINSMCYPTMPRRTGVLSSAAFGIFQGAMPILGFWAGSAFSSAISNVDHWLAFALLGLIGGKMLVECLRDWNQPMQCSVGQTLSGKMILTQAIATSIDALAVGISLAALQANVYSASACIAVITFVCCLFGHALGKQFGARLGKWAQLLGGAILVGIGVKILLEHLG